MTSLAGAAAPPVSPAFSSGDVVADFGCGGGIDVILAAHRVGPEGKVVGIDFADQMIQRARQGISQVGMEDRDIALHVADIKRSELPDAFADVMMSNCVINLIPDKAAVYQEAFRVLRPGGRTAISDIVLTEDIEPELRERFRALWAGCLGGAIPEEDYSQTVSKAGFTGLQVVARHTLTPKEIESLACCPGEEFTPPPAKGDLARVQGKVVSIKFTAVKPAPPRSR